MKTNNNRITRHGELVSPRCWPSLLLRGMFVYILLCLAVGMSQAKQEHVRTIHVFVALCDNVHQGIVPVSAVLGNGEDAANNLYWGAMYGVKAFLKRSAEWKLVETRKDVSDDVIERAVFQHKTKGACLIADAYRGSKIKEALKGFFNATAGNNPQRIKIGENEISSHGGANLIIYVGHNGLMDFGIEQTKPKDTKQGKDAIVLACKSKPYFFGRLSEMGAKSILLTTGFMAPEAYTLQAAVNSWLADVSASEIREQAAVSYSKYQKCSLKAARSLFFSEGQNKSETGK